ncbi:hypothetical protein [Proteiniphilum acetatigenes]|uniref:5'-methylthioadenosine/S-adenosylhomocysteine nucleosidase family protein n=1 Tax=Proteiniphilum acetatigenes TaxID=294710 RepID=UPI00036D1FFA|nr:adenosylhomocysteine nucleosidase [Porphyromonadaceae bacterium KH3CP3RA]
MIKKVFVTYAVKEEFIPLKSEGCNIVHIQTGVGKTKSAYILTKYICQNKPDLVLNIGTAGTLIHDIGDIFIANHFIDRDYEATQLPGIEYEINGIELLGSTNLSLRNRIMKYEKQGICSTGDTFITEAASFQGDIVDMEAYAQAYVCKELNVTFLSVKYITDIIGRNSVKHWENKLAEARAGLAVWFEEQNILSALCN